MNIIIPRHFLHLVYVRPCLDVDLFITYLCNLFFFFSLIIINQIISLKQTHLPFCNFAQNMPNYFWKSKESKRKERKQIISQQQKFGLRVLLSFCLIFFYQFQSGDAYKKSVYSISTMLENTLLVNFSNYEHYYLRHFSNRSVCPWYGSQSIPQTHQHKLSNEA